jgi:two-component system, LuxR family, sensor kinase FixL
LAGQTLNNPLKQLSFQVLFDAAADAMLLVNNNGQILEANASALQLLEYTEKEIVGLEVEALMPVNTRHHHQQYRDNFYKNLQKRSMGNGRDLFALSKSGKELAVDIGLSPIESQGQIYVLITFYPAHKRHEAEQALRASEERLQLAKQAARFGVFDYDLKLNIIHWDERMRELWGGESDQFISYEKFMTAIHTDDRTRRQNVFDQASDPAGSGEYKIKYRIINAIDNIERWVAIIGRMHFENGKAVRLIGVVQDITERKLIEKTLQEHRTESETIFTQQVAARTASAIAHELNQPLAAISAYSDVAIHALNNPTFDPEKLKRALEGCVAQTQRAGTSLHELMAFLHEGKSITEPFDLNEAVANALNIAKSNGLKEFKPILELEQNIPAVLANRIQVQKVLVNLLRNSVEAMRGAGIPDSAITITVHTNQEVNMGHVTVQDNGPGVNQDVAKRIFEPFFTTKTTGIGMGLAISRSMVEANGGQLWMEANSQAGAKFHFTLPFAQ